MKKIKKSNVVKIYTALITNFEMKASSYTVTALFTLTYLDDKYVEKTTKVAFKSTINSSPVILFTQLSNMQAVCGVSDIAKCVGKELKVAFKEGDIIRYVANKDSKGKLKPIFNVDSENDVLEGSEESLPSLSEEISKSAVMLFGYDFNYKNEDYVYMK
jgi:hypothetical protein